VSYNHKHNEANGEGNRDGEDHNRSWNCGAEGPTDDPGALALRARQRRNFLATLMLSQGVPMLLHGDELGRTQGGNNNAYCQDNELSWMNWELTDEDSDLLRFVSDLIALRTQHPTFRRHRWFQGRTIRGTDEIAWLRPDGESMSEADWQAGFVKAVGCYLNGDAIHATDERGRGLRDEDFLILFNASEHTLEWQIPVSFGAAWELVLDTAAPLEPGDPSVLAAGEVLARPDRSLAVLIGR